MGIIDYMHELYNDIMKIMLNSNSAYLYFAKIMMSPSENFQFLKKANMAL